jgi:hypothetical protein
MPHHVHSIPAELLNRIRAEYLEMPGLRVTPHQAQRLWGLDEQTCHDALTELVAAGFLMKTPTGQYSRRTTGPEARMLKADLAHAPRQRAAS